jgi:hypothetical protein
VNLKITFRKLVKEEILDLEKKDSKGRTLSLKYFINELKVEEGDGSWGLFNFPDGPGTYYAVTTMKLRDDIFL